MQETRGAERSVRSIPREFKSTFDVVNRSARCVDKCAAAIKKGTSVEECFEEMEFWLFAAMSVKKSGVLGDQPTERLHDLGSKALEILKDKKQQISKAMKAIEGVSEKLNSSSCQRRSEVIKRAFDKSKGDFPKAEKLKGRGLQIETIENFQNIQCGRAYVRRLWNVFNHSKLAADFREAYDTEMEIWAYWSCYDACVTRLAEYGLKVEKTTTASHSVKECLSAFTSLQKWTQSFGTSEGNLRNPKIVADAETFQSKSDIKIQCATKEAAADESSSQVKTLLRVTDRRRENDKKQLLRERQVFERQLQDKNRQLDELRGALEQTKAELMREKVKLKPSPERKCTTEAAFQTTGKAKIGGHYGAPPSPLRFQSDPTGSRHDTAAQCSLLNGNEANNGKVKAIFYAKPDCTDSEAVAIDRSQVHGKEYSDQQHKMKSLKGRQAAADDIGQRDLTNSTLQPLSLIKYEVEEISDPRRPSEMAKRFEDLFNYSYDLSEVIENERKCSEFTLEILMTVHRAAVMELTEVGSKVVQAVGLSGDVDNPSAKKTILECSVSLCKLSNRLQRRSCDSIRETAEKWRKKHGVLLDHANEFLKKCVPVCWDLVLQKRALSLVTDHKVFNSSKHELFFGSDKTSKEIDHFVWPCLIEEGTNRILVKGKVITKTAETTEKNARS